MLALVTCHIFPPSIWYGKKWIPGTLHTQTDRSTPPQSQQTEIDFLSLYVRKLSGKQTGPFLVWSFIPGPISCPGTLTHCLLDFWKIVFFKKCTEPPGKKTGSTKEDIKWCSDSSININNICCEYGPTRQAEPLAPDMKVSRNIWIFFTYVFSFAFQAKHPCSRLNPQCSSCAHARWKIPSAITFFPSPSGHTINSIVFNGFNGKFIHIWRILHCHRWLLEGNYMILYVIIAWTNMTCTRKTTWVCLKIVYSQWFPLVLLIIIP